MSSETPRINKFIKEELHYLDYITFEGGALVPE